MSSNSHIAVAKPCFVAAPVARPLWSQARDAAPSSERPVLTRLWKDLVAGRYRVIRETSTPTRVTLVAVEERTDVGVARADADVLAYVLCGGAQKTIAADLGIAPSTTSGRCVRALARLGVSPQRVPLVVVLAAQSAGGVQPMPTAEVNLESDGTPASIAVTVRRSPQKRIPQLTAAEHEIARAIVDGHTRLQIAQVRATSVHTVARQFHSIFEAMRVTGRFALIRRVIEVGAF